VAERREARAGFFAEHRAVLVILADELVGIFSRIAVVREVGVGHACARLALFKRAFVVVAAVGGVLARIAVEGDLDVDARARAARAEFGSGSVQHMRRELMLAHADVGITALIVAVQGGGVRSVQAAGHGASEGEVLDLELGDDLDRGSRRVDRRPVGRGFE